jgi:gamma-glutamyltranspeptidase/glutathione hydrolase
MKFDWNNPYPTIRAPLFSRNAVATSQPLAAQAGAAMLRLGGNAVDAALAAAAVLTIVELVSNGIGSDTFAIVRDGVRLPNLNGFGNAPMGWTPKYFMTKYGVNATAIRPKRGWDTVTVPGAGAAWAGLHEKFGKLSFSGVIGPAAELVNKFRSGTGHGSQVERSHRRDAGTTRFR